MQGSKERDAIFVFIIRLWNNECEHIQFASGWWQEQFGVCPWSLEDLSTNNPSSCQWGKLKKMLNLCWQSLKYDRYQNWFSFCLPADYKMSSIQCWLCRLKWKINIWQIITLFSFFITFHMIHFMPVLDKDISAFSWSIQKLHQNWNWDQWKKM